MITNLITVIIILVMIVLAIKYGKKLNEDVEYDSYIPDTIAAIGIIGTFIGIVIGLLNFNTDNIQGSVPILLQGMKTAFITSVFGLIISTGLKTWTTSVKRKNGSREVSIEDKLSELITIMKNSDNSVVANAVLALKDSTIESNKQMVSNLSSVEKSVNSLVSEDERSLASQMKSLREGMIESQNRAQDRLNTGLESMSSKLENLVNSNNAISAEIERGNNKLIEEFIGFRENMAEAFSQQFIKAIQDAIEDLNTQLQEQLGENFKNAVNKLVDWQEHYIETIKETTNILNATKDSLITTEKSMDTIANRAASLTSLGDKLTLVIKGLHTVYKYLDSSLKSLKETAVDVNSTVPSMVENLHRISKESIEASHSTVEGYNNIGIKLSSIARNMVSELDTLSKNVNNDLSVLTNNLTNSINNTYSTTSSHLQNVTEGIKNSSNLIEATVSSHIDNMKKVNENMAINQDKLIEGIEERLKSVFDQTGNTMNQLVENLHKESNDNLENLSSTLKSVSAKFVDDYIPLTEKLRKVVELSKRI